MPPYALTVIAVAVSVALYVENAVYYHVVVIVNGRDLYGYVVAAHAHARDAYCQRQNRVRSREMIGADLVYCGDLGLVEHHHAGKIELCAVSGDGCALVALVDVLAALDLCVRAFCDLKPALAAGMPVKSDNDIGALDNIDCRHRIASCCYAAAVNVLVSVSNVPATSSP